MSAVAEKKNVAQHTKVLEPKKAKLVSEAAAAAAEIRKAVDQLKY